MKKSWVMVIRIPSIYRSLFFDEFNYAFKKKNAIPRLLIEFFDPRIKYDISFSDFKPFLRQLSKSRWLLGDIILKS